MWIDSQRGVDAVEADASDHAAQMVPANHDPELAQLIQRREAEIERLLASRKPEFIRLGIEAYVRDLPRLLAENRYRQKVAYRGNELIAFGATYRQLRSRLARKGFTERGELFVTTIAPLEVDEDDDGER
jgi:hypothetical protein